jgi:hypothetical protein
VCFAAPQLVGVDRKCLRNEGSGFLGILTKKNMIVTQGKRKNPNQRKVPEGPKHTVDFL